MTPVKHCSRCRRILPATTEFFFADYHNPDGTVKRWKSACKDCTRARARKRHHHNRVRPAPSTPVDREKDVWLDIRPFRAWLNRMIELYDMGGAARRIGVHDRAVYRWLREGQQVHIDVVDRCLVTEGDTDLWQLYPDLYRDEEAA